MSVDTLPTEAIVNTSVEDATPVAPSFLDDADRIMFDKTVGAITDRNEMVAPFSKSRSDVATRKNELLNAEGSTGNVELDELNAKYEELLEKEEKLASFKKEVSAKRTEIASALAKESVGAVEIPEHITVEIANLDKKIKAAKAYLKSVDPSLIDLLPDAKKAGTVSGHAGTGTIKVRGYDWLVNGISVFGPNGKSGAGVVAKELGVGTEIVTDAFIKAQDGAAREDWKKDVAFTIGEVEVRAIYSATE